MKRLLKNLGLLLLSSIVAAGLAELFLRIWTPDTIAFKHLRQPDSVLHHSLKPSASYILKTSDFEVEVKTNSMGFRDREWNPETNHEFKILVLGNSFVEGYGVVEDSCFVERLERELNAIGGHNYRVLNFGVASYSPIIEYLLLKNRGLALDPQLVVLCFDMSDIQDDILYADDTDFDSTGRPVAVRPGYISYGRPSWFLQQGASANFIRKYSYLYAFLYPIANRLKPEPPPGIRTLKGRIMHTEDSLAGRWQEYFSRTESYIRLIARLLQAKEIPFLLVVYPWGHQVSASEWVEGRKLFGLKPKTYNSAIFGSLELFAHETSISFLNMTPAFRRRSNGSLYFSIDEHWTNEGHRVAAETLARFLIETDLIHHEDDPEQKR